MSTEPELEGVLNIRVSTENWGNPDRPRRCDWRDSRTCQVPAVVDVWIGDVDEEGGSANYCQVHSEVVIGAAVTRLVTPFRGLR
jgi:hypothetical protein